MGIDARLLGLVVSGAMVSSASAFDVYRIVYVGGVKTYQKINYTMTVPSPLAHPQVNPVFGNNQLPTTICEEVDLAGPVGAAGLGYWEVQLGINSFGAAEGDTQTLGVYTALAQLPPADGYAIVFTYDLSTWDSFGDEFGLCGGGGGGNPLLGARPESDDSGGGGSEIQDGPWDLFTVNLNQAGAYWELVEGGSGTIEDCDPIVSPFPAGQVIDPVDPVSSVLPGASWAFGGLAYADGVLETALGRAVLEFEGSNQLPYFLSVSLDTDTELSQDDRFPSWGIFNDLTKCQADWNLDGVVDDDDLFEFFANFGSGTLVFDFNKDGVVDDLDFFDFFFVWNDQKVNSCTRFKLCSLTSPGT